MQGSITYQNGSAFLEETGPENTTIRYKLKEVLHSAQSRFQLIEVADSADYGRMLILDGCVNVCERDEAVYHEMIAHIPVLMHPEPARVLVIGGGDGGTVRELLRHPAVQHIDVVEIDVEVISACKRYFPSLAESFSNSRVRVHTEDGIAYVKKAKAGTYSIIIIDSSDPMGPAEGLYKFEFYEDCRRILNNRGIVVAQSESPYMYPAILKLMHGLFQDIYTSVRPYRIAMPTYPSGQLYFMLGGMENLNPPYFDESRTEMFFYEHAKKLRYLTVQMLGGVFEVPVEIQEMLSE